MTRRRHTGMAALLLVVAACRGEQQGAGTAPLPEPALPKLRLVLTPDTGTLVRATLALGDDARLTVGAFTATVEFDPGQMTPVDWVTAPGGMLLASDSTGTLRLAGIHAEGLPVSAPLAVVRFAWPGRAGTASPPMRLTVPELASPQGVSQRAQVTVERGASWQ
jgi:hypothetical protein